MEPDTKGLLSSPSGSQRYVGTNVMTFLPDTVASESTRGKAHRELEK